MKYPVPSNPWQGREELKGDPEWADKVLAACKKSWDVDTAWYIGDTAMIWMNTEKKTLDEFYVEHYVNKGLTGISLDSYRVMCEVCIAFPGPVRDLSRSFFDHYCGWLMFTYPDGVSKYLDNLDPKDYESSGGFDQEVPTLVFPERP